MAVRIKEACAKCGRAMTDVEIGDYWHHSEREPSFRCLCTLCAQVYRFFEPDGSVKHKQWVDGMCQPTLL